VAAGGGGGYLATRHRRAPRTGATPALTSFFRAVHGSSAGACNMSDEHERWVLSITRAQPSQAAEAAGEARLARLRYLGPGEAAAAQQAALARISELESTVGELRVELEYCMQQLTMREASSDVERAQRQSLEARVAQVTSKPTDRLPSV
jgi:hypothetical protein